MNRRGILISFLAGLFPSSLFGGDKQEIEGDTPTPETFTIFGEDKQGTPNHPNIYNDMKARGFFKIPHPGLAENDNDRNRRLLFLQYILTYYAFTPDPARNEVLARIARLIYAKTPPIWPPIGRSETYLLEFEQYDPEIRKGIKAEIKRRIGVG